MTEILLFNPYYSSPLDTPETTLASMPLNLLYLATYLKERGLDCKIEELGIHDPKQVFRNGSRMRSGKPDDVILDILNREKPKIIGIGCMYSRHYIDVVKLSRWIKCHSDALVVIGGNHATVFCDSVLREPSVDVVVRGEGEITFYALCRALLAGNQDLGHIQGIAFKNVNQEIIETAPRPLSRNLDAFNIDHSLIDVKAYTRHSPYRMRDPVIGIISSRGCPNNCIYCTVNAVWGRRWRGRSPKHTVDEIERLHKDYGFQEFAILDDSASVNRKRWIGICDEIIGRNLDIRWTTPNGIAHWTLDRSILRKMKAAGCYRVTFGIESGNPETRKYIRKTHPLSQAREMIRYANRIGMWTICTNILGFPRETARSMADTVRFAKDSGTDFATFFLLSPMVASEVYRHFKQDGLLDFDHIFLNHDFDENSYDEMNRHINDQGAPTNYFTAEELRTIRSEAYSQFLLSRLFRFLLNPLHLVHKIRSMEDLRYMVRLGKTGFNILKKSFSKNTSRTLLWS